MLKAILLLVVSNVFMTIAWYGHLKHHRHSPLIWVILISWGIALIEYCFQVPANRLLKELNIPLAWLKAIQEIITLLVFVGFSVFYMKESLKWNEAVGFLFLVLAAFFIFYKPHNPMPLSPATATADSVQSNTQSNKP